MHENGLMDGWIEMKMDRDGWIEMKMDGYLLWIAELLENRVVIVTSETIGETDGRFDVGLESALQQLVHLAVVIVVVADTKHALDVIPNGPPEAGRVHVPLGAHRVVRQVVRQPEFLVDQIAHVAVQSVDQRVGVVIPRIVLHPERRYQTLAAFCAPVASASIREIL